MTALLATFLLGIANFALHKAVLESGHPLLGRMPFMNMLGPRASLAAEFLVLLGAMLLTVGVGLLRLYRVQRARRLAHPDAADLGGTGPARRGFLTHDGSAAPLAGGQQCQRRQ